MGFGVVCVSVSVCFSVFLCVSVCVCVYVCVSGWPGLELTGCVWSEAQQRECVGLEEEGVWESVCQIRCLCDSLRRAVDSRGSFSGEILKWFSGFLSGARRLLLTTFALIVSSTLAAFHLFMTVGLHCVKKVSLPVPAFLCVLSLCVTVLDLFSVVCFCTSHTWLHISIYVEFWVSTPHLVSTSVDVKEITPVCLGCSRHSRPIRESHAIYTRSSSKNRHQCGACTASVSQFPPSINSLSTKWLLQSNINIISALSCYNSRHHCILKTQLP